MQKQPTLLIATGLYPPQIGGPATHSRVLEHYLPSKGVKVYVLPFSSVATLPAFFRHVLYFIRCYRLAKKADVVYALDPFSVGFPALCAAVLAGKKFIVRVAGDYAWEQGTQRFGVKESLDDFVKKKEGHSLRVRFFKRIQTYVAQNAYRVVVPSKYMKKIVGAWGIDSEKIDVVYTSFEPDIVHGNRRTLRGLLRFRGKMIISIGRLVPWKGFTALIEIMPELIKRYADMRLFIVGSGPDMEVLEQRAKELNVEKYVSLGGKLDHDVMLRYIQAADIFVLNTGYEGFSHLLLEVMSVGTPIVTTNVGGNPELITHDKNGLFVGYNNKKQLMKAICQLLDSQGLRKKLSDNAYSSLDHFTHEKMVEALIPVLFQE